MPQTSSHSRSWLGIVGILLGCLGIVLCLAALVVLWTASSRLGRAADRVFGALDQSLVAAGERVAQTQDRIQSAKITAADVEKSLRDWTGREAGQRVALQLNLEERTERLADILQQADDWLDVAESSAGVVSEFLSASGFATEPGKTPSVDRLLEELAAVRAQLTDATGAVAHIHERIAAAGEEQSAGERIQQAAQFTVRLAATLGLLDSRLEQFADRISDAQSQLQQLKSTAQWWLQLTSIGVTLVILLMAAGQVAMCRLAWNGLRESRGPAN